VRSCAGDGEDWKAGVVGTARESQVWAVWTKARPLSFFKKILFVSKSILKRHQYYNMLLNATLEEII
jgi:hypothetical protein